MPKGSAGVIPLRHSRSQPVKAAVIAYQWWHGMGGFASRDTTAKNADQP